MEEKTMLKLALATSIIGLVSLAIISEFATISSYTVAEAETAKGDFKITGTVGSLRDGKDITRFKLADESGEIDVVLFNDADITNGDIVEVEGKAGDYRGKKQIVAKRIIPIMP